MEEQTSQPPEPAPARLGDSQHNAPQTRATAPESPRWQRGDRPTAAADWEITDYYGSFDDPRP